MALALNGLKFRVQILGFTGHGHGGRCRQTTIREIHGKSFSYILISVWALTGSDEGGRCSHVWSRNVLHMTIHTDINHAMLCVIFVVTPPPPHNLQPSMLAYC